MKTKKFFRLVIYDLEISTVKTIDYPCAEWEVCCILVPSSMTKMYVEFKKYLPDHSQEVQGHYVNAFSIIERLVQPIRQQHEVKQI